MKRLTDIIDRVRSSSGEKEWVEFKRSNADPETVGRLVSALSNSARLHGRDYGYLVFGVEDGTHRIVGTDFRMSRAKKGGEELEHWLSTRLDPRIDFIVSEFDYRGKTIVLLEIPAAVQRPVRFLHQAYIRVGSYTKNLNQYPEKERKIWELSSKTDFESLPAKSDLTEEEVVNCLDIQSYFDLMELPFPSSRKGILDKLGSEKLVTKKGGLYAVTNLGAVLFAKNLEDFGHLARKALRVLIYNGNDRLSTQKDITHTRGYAAGFAGLLEYINDRLPSNEEMGKALRRTVRMYPETAVRELVANGLIHQDFSERGIGVMVEIFADRIEFTSPGKPVITPLRFIDEYQSRNERLASFMRRMGICEERGSGIDKVVSEVERYQLPAPDFLEMEKHTRAVLFSYRKLKDMDRQDKIRACYQHCCLKYVSNEKMTNKSLRERFKIDARNYPAASRIITDTMKSDLIKYDDPENRSKKYTKYIPWWA
ncbi:MAG: transcriptional regulator [Proteobacteria bacterium]|nr:transcriptional regulator [Pseudomonadota bacterium]